MKWRFAGTRRGIQSTCNVIGFSLSGLQPAAPRICPARRRATGQQEKEIRMMQKVWLVVCLAALALVSSVQAAEVDPAQGQGASTRFASLRNLWGQPAGTMSSLGGYIPASGCGCYGAGGAQVDSPTGCTGVWNGYQARPCGLHRHYADGGNGGGCNTCGTGSACGSDGACGGGGCGNTSWGGCGCGRGWGGYGGGWGGGPIVTGALGCGCGCAPAPTCNSCKRHHCPLFGHHCRRQSACDCQTAACGDAVDSTPASTGPSFAPTPAPEQIQPQIEQPGPSAERAPRRFRPFTALKSLDKEKG